MSKELEAFKDIKEIIDDLPVGLFDIIEDYDDKYDDDENEPMNLIEQALQELEELRRSNKEMRKQLDEAYSKMPHANDCLAGEDDE